MNTGIYAIVNTFIAMWLWATSNPHGVITISTAEPIPPTAWSKDFITLESYGEDAELVPRYSRDTIVVCPGPLPPRCDCYERSLGRRVAPEPDGLCPNGDEPMCVTLAVHRPCYRKKVAK